MKPHFWHNSISSRLITYAQGDPPWISFIPWIVYRTPRANISISTRVIHLLIRLIRASSSYFLSGANETDPLTALFCKRCLNSCMIRICFAWNIALIIYSAEIYHLLSKYLLVNSRSRRVRIKLLINKNYLFQKKFYHYMRLNVSHIKVMRR